MTESQVYTAAPNDAADEFFEHFGVPGMKWGQRKGSSSPTNRQLNRASKARDAASRRENIDAARQRINSGMNRQNYKDAKQKYKTDKLAMGTREAKKILAGVKEKNVQDWNTANQVRDGRERAKAILAGAAGLGILAALQVANNR